MQSLSAKVFSLLAVICFVLCVALQMAASVFALNVFWNAVFYLVSFVGVLFIGFATAKNAAYSPAFDLKGKKHMSLISYLCAVGFFVDFVKQAVNAYLTYKTVEYSSVLVLIPMCIASLMAISSSIYFLAIGLSYSDYGYDFKNLKLLHIAPTLWAIASGLGVMSQAVSPLKDVNLVVKYIAITASALYFLFLAKEVESDRPALKLTVFFSMSFSYFGFMLFLITVMLALTHKAGAISVVDAVTLLFISQFSFFQQIAIKSK